MEGKHEIVHDDGHHSSINRIVAIALDASENAQIALEWAAEHILKPETDLVVLLNARPVPVVYPGPSSVPVDFSGYLAKMEEQNRTVSHNILKKAADYLKPKKFRLKAISLCGDARDEIARKVDELNAELLVVGSRGMGAVKRAFIGSTSDHLVHHVRCAVIVVKENGSGKSSDPTIGSSKQATKEIGSDVSPVPA